MAENSKIEWTDHTFNPWTGCTKVSPGCDHCYAEGWSKRSGTVRWGAGEPRRRTTEANWRLPLKWNAQAEREGQRFRVFCSSLADVFDNEVPTAWRADLFRLIEATPHLHWLLLTKRIGNAAEMMFLARGGHLPLLPNVWIGATVVNQAEADRDIPKLLQVPARVRFLSIEPMLGPIDLEAFLWKCCGEQGPTGVEYMGASEYGCCNKPLQRDALHWVICGGESGPGARPMHPDWARSLRDQCTAAGVPFLFKQWGEWSPTGPLTSPDCAVDRQARTVQPMWRGNFPAGATSSDGWQRMYRVGKKAAGRLLDGVQHDGFPA